MLYLGGYAFLFAFSIVMIVLGFKGFGPQGLPLTETKRVTGTPAKIIGSVCILLGATFMLSPPIFGLYFIFRLVSRPDKSIPSAETSAQSTEKNLPKSPDEIRAYLKLNGVQNDDGRKVQTQLAKFCTKSRNAEVAKDADAEALRKIAVGICMSVDGSTLYARVGSEKDWPESKKFLETELIPKLEREAIPALIPLPRVIQVVKDQAAQPFQQPFITVDIIARDKGKEIEVTPHDSAGNPIPDTKYRQKKASR
jgi:hypothetical protein